MHSTICHADLLRAFARLAAKDDDTRREIAALLGFDWQPPTAAGAVADGASDDAQEEEPGPPIKPWINQKPPPDPPPPPREARTGDIRVVPAGTATPPALSWPSGVTALKPGTLGRAPAPTPLFRSQWIRAILSASLSARLPIGAPDMARAVEVIARGEALSTLPRLPILTLAPGVQALIDIGEGMQPFWHDRVVLRRDLRRIVGDGGLELLQCAGSPRRARREDGADWEDYEKVFPPKLGACVLIVSDFGLNAGRARGAGPYTWVVLARRLARRGHRVVGFVPYPPARWPNDLSRAFVLVPWDHGTSAGRIGLARQRRAAR